MNRIEIVFLVLFFFLKPAYRSVVCNRAWVMSWLSFTRAISAISLYQRLIKWVRNDRYMGNRALNAGPIPFFLPCLDWNTQPHNCRSNLLDCIMARTFFKKHFKRNYQLINFNQKKKNNQIYVSDLFTTDCFI